MKTVAIVPAAGSGKRLGLKVKKPFVLLKGKPLITYTLTALNSSRVIDGIIIASDRTSIGHLKRLVRKYRFKKIIDIVVGGKTRFESVHNCLQRIDPSFDIVLIHDGARPFIEGTLIERSVRLAARFGGCITAVPEHDTVKLSSNDMFVKKTLDRSMVFRAQTPQSFRRKLIEKAYGVKNIANVTDDSSLVEMLGKKVKILSGSYRNIKITTREDLKFAEVLL